MSTIASDPLADPRLRVAVVELEGLIQQRYPAATFVVFRGLGDDTEGVYLEATVDVADTDDVVDLVIDRLVDLQVDDGLPIRVMPVRPRDRHLGSFGARPIPLDPD